MSEMHHGARPVDPLDALRAADHRPLPEIWRERLRARLSSGLSPAVRRIGATTGLAAVVAVVVWQLLSTTGPPVEASIPLARGDAPDVAVTSPIVAPEASAVVEIEQLATSGRVVVHVAGAVLHPGLVSGETGWRIDDAVRAAGGPLIDADLDRLNLAAFIEDGQRVFVPLEGQDEPVVVTAQADTGGDDRSGPVNVNRADAALLETLPGVGPATAETIIAHREEHGNFADVDALVAVRGIGPATIEALRDHVTVR
jgi:competence protein ComEA